MSGGSSRPAASVSRAALAALAAVLLFVPLLIGAGAATGAVAAASSEAGPQSRSIESVTQHAPAALWRAAGLVPGGGVLREAARAGGDLDPILVALFGAVTLAAILARHVGVVARAHVPAAPARRGARVTRGPPAPVPVIA